MNLKRISTLLYALLAFAFHSAAQSPVYTFSTTRDTAIEGNILVIAGYVKADVTPVSDDSLLVVLKSGAARPSHMDVTVLHIIRFPAGVDSVPFSIQLSNDDYPEYTEHVTYAIRNYGTAAAIGVDSLLNFVLLDNDLPATIGFVIDTGSAWIDDGTYQVCETINNPNSFPVRFFTRTYDCVFLTPLAVLTACGGYNYFYDWDTAYAPPGLTTRCEDIRIVGDTSVKPDKTLLVMIQNVDANIITDSVFHFTIKNDNGYYPPSVSFDTGGISIVRDTNTTMQITVPITTINPNHHGINFSIDTLGFSSSLLLKNSAAFHFTLGYNYFSHADGIFHDTIVVNILDDNLIYDTINSNLHIRGVKQNLSADTLYHINIIDTGTLLVSFKGAGFAHLKDDSVGYVQVYTNYPAPFPIKADVSYLNGNAVYGVDYLWTDTTVTFPPSMYDTISLPVLMLKNHVHDGNKQINLRMSNVVSPVYIYSDIIQYTYTIIDNDSTAAFLTGLVHMDNNNLIKVYPNPFDNDVNVHTDAVSYELSVFNMLGEKVYTAREVSGNIKIDLSSVAAGIYTLQICTTDNKYVMLITKH